MATIIDIDELVGEDIIVRAGGQEYRIPTDISTEDVFDLFQCYVDSLKIESDNPDEIVAQVRSKMEAIEARQLQLLRVRHPDLDKVPWGIKGTPAVLRGVLAELGMVVTPDPPKPSPKSTPKRTTVKSRPRR